MKRQSLDGCTAATYIAYAFSDVATIYPITPIASMGETADKWSVAGLKNLYGAPMQVREMESELGAAGATHGALAAGALATTFTASQGLMLMIPNMYKISGELLPGVFHVGCRSLATQALSIFGDHQDVMACRATGFAMLASASVQETHDLAIAAHLAALEASLPVLHFFDGWRTSNETATIRVASYDELKPLVPWKAVGDFRRRAMNPEHPDLRGSAQNWDVYFQNREAPNRLYDAMPSVMQKAFDKVNALMGTDYHLFDYSGDPEATDVVVTMGSSAQVAEAAVAQLNKEGKKYGVVKVRLYRPFDAKAMLGAIPGTVKRIAVLDRTKEPGSLGEPLFLDVAAAVKASGRAITVIGGRYGLSSKEFDPTMVKAVFLNLESSDPKVPFTVGIDDDLTHLSLPVAEPLKIDTSGVKAAVFFGMGSDGTVGATRTAAGILSDGAGLWTQAYFEYSAKKSGGYTICQLRAAPGPMNLAFGIEQAGYVGCNKDRYVSKFPLARTLAPGGILTVNTSWDPVEAPSLLPDSLKKQLAEKKARLYFVDAGRIARESNLGVRINMIMLAVFFRLSADMDYPKAISLLKEKISEMYRHEGNQVVADNLEALSKAGSAIREVAVDPAWAGLSPEKEEADPSWPEFVRDVAVPCDRLEGNSLPVSAFTPDGTMPMGTTAYEKRQIADFIPQWDVDKCVECTECSLVCAHASIRPWLLNPEEKEKAPLGLTSKSGHGPLAELQYRIQVYPQDCTGCGSCAVVCPGHALTMVPIDSQLDEQKQMLGYVTGNVSLKPGLVNRETVAGSQFYQPLLEFSGACAGCGETPYVKLLTQLMGERMVIANATGCSSIWGANYPSNAYCTNSEGHGPAWGNSLFEDNAEYGYGMAVAIAHRRAHLASMAEEAVADISTPGEVRDALRNWLEVRGVAGKSAEAGKKALALLASHPEVANAAEMTGMADMWAKKSIWAIGGDGWAYDIGFAGLDHVLAQDVDINILVMDTECYSNTGGQTSKATPLGAVAKYAANGKSTFKKNLGRMMMAYPHVYVASIALGANFQQAIDALTEADAHDGPSIVIAYCPCINHGIRAGMGHSIVEERKAVETGYWDLFRRNPSKVPALQVDSAAPDVALSEFLDGEDRYADLKVIDAARAAVLRPELEDRLDALYALLRYNARYVGPKPEAD